MSDLPDPVERELERHEAFEPAADGYALTTTVFDATTAASTTSGHDAGRFRIAVRLPTLDAAVADETVAPVVEDGWFETLERRLRDVFTVADPLEREEPIVERRDDEVVVRLEYVAPTASDGVADAKALIEFVEGTYAQGIVPGYEYEGPAATLLESAQQRGQQAGGKEGGAPM